MKENKYDDDTFFRYYCQFPRSLRGLSAAGEWHEFKRMLPDFSGKQVLDIGCGFGWHTNYAIENGAKSVLGTDISEKMLAEARHKTVSDKIEYHCSAMEDLSFKPQRRVCFFCRAPYFYCARSPNLDIRQ